MIEIRDGWVVKSFEGRNFLVTPDTSEIVDDAEPMLERLKAIKPGDVFLDVGAGCGLYSLRAAAMGAEVIAFEPHPQTREKLRRNVDLNRLDDHTSRITVLEFALFDGGEYPVELHAEVFGRHYPIPDNYEVEVAKLDEFEFEKVDWIKLDVEGAELGVIQGGHDTIAKYRPNLLIEDHDGINSDPECVVSRYAERIDSSFTIQQWLTLWGYRIDILPWGCGRRFIVATAR
jgi:FkbM family methyltransferase